MSVFIACKQIIQLIQKCGACHDQVSGIFRACCFIRGVHGELGKSDVHRRHGNLGVGNISQGGTAGDIAPVRKDLCRYFYAAAKVAEEGGGESVSGVFLLGIEFNDDAFIQARRVYGIGIFSMIRMERVAVVGGNHEASGNHGLCFVIAVTQRTGDSCQCILEEGGTGALICGAANFFIIEKGVNTDMLFLFPAVNPRNAAKAH